MLCKKPITKSKTSSDSQTVTFSKPYITELEFFIKKWYFTAFLILLAVIGFGFTTTHLTVNIDSLAGDIYNGSGNTMIASGRFGMTFWAKLLSNEVYQIETSYSTGIIGVTMLLFAAINFCVLFRRASNDTLSFPSYVIFAGIFISYPLINEIWEYNGMELIIGGGYLFVSLSLLLIYDQIEAGKINVLKFIAVIFILTIICSSYESLIITYIFVTLAIIFLREKQENNWRKHFNQGVIYAIFLIAGVVLRLIVHKLLLMIMGIAATTNGATQLYWIEDGSVFKTIKLLINTIGFNHFLVSPYYFPLLVFSICIVCFFICTIYTFFKKKCFSGFLMLGMMSCTELLSIIQGRAVPYRTCQVFALFIAFSLMLFVNQYKCRNIFTILLCFLCLQQSIYLNYLFTLNQLRYEEEVQVIDRIYEDIENLNLDKPILFVGEYSLSEHISKPKNLKIGNNVYDRKFPETNINSVLNWSKDAFISTHPNVSMTEELFSYHNYNIICTENYERDLDRYNKLNSESELPYFPNDGYIIELENLLIVKIGPTE